MAPPRRLRVDDLRAQPCGCSSARAAPKSSSPAPATSCTWPRAPSIEQPERQGDADRGGPVGVGRPGHQRGRAGVAKPGGRRTLLSLNGARWSAPYGELIRPVSSGRVESDPFAVDDPRDEVQARAHALVGHVCDTALTELRIVVIRDEPLGRLGLSYLSQSVEYLSHAHFLLRPGEQVFHRALLTGGVLRTMADLYGRCIEVWAASDSEKRMGEIAAQSVRQELLAFDAAKHAGADVESFLDVLDAQASLLPSPTGVNVANVLEAVREDEMLTVYRFESAHIHFGEAARRARIRTLEESAAGTLDVHLEPPSLWRVGQLTWATLGVWRRLASFICVKLDLGPSVLKLAAEVEPNVRATAQRAHRESEPLSPPYHAFSFPMWGQPE